SQDVTRREEAEAALRASEEMFSKAYNNSPIAMAIRDAESGRLVQCNDAYCALTGYPRDEVIGRTPEESELWASQSEPLDGLVSRFTRDGHVRGTQVRLRCKSGEIRTVQTSAESITVEGRVCALITLVDLTPRVEAEASLIESEERFHRL